jgi:hypothetical protein
MFPALHASKERFIREMDTIDEMVHVLLKGHLLLEEELASIIDQHVFHRENVAEARLSFSQKLSLARSLCLRKNKLGEWDLVAAINGLRNNLAHGLNSPDREKRLEKLKSIYFREAADFGRIEQIKAASDHEIVFAACAHCVGFLAKCADDLRQLRHIIHEMDRQMYPELPPFEL